MSSRRIPLVGIVLLSLGLLLGLVLAGCGTETNEEAAVTTSAAENVSTTAQEVTSTSAAPAQFDGEIRVGVLCSLTGGSAIMGAEQKWAHEKAAADINASGGVDVGGKKMKLELVIADDQSDTNATAAAMEKLIKVENCELILSTNGTPFNLAAAQVAEKYHAYFHMTSTYADVVRDSNLKWCTDLFFSAPAVAEVPFGMVETQPAADRPTRWGILTQDNADGQALGEGVKAMAAKHNAEIVIYEAYTPGSKDYSSSILKFKENEVDALVCFIYPSDGITFVQQMKEQQFSPKYMMGWVGFWPTEFLNALGPSSDYICFDGFWSMDLDYPGAKELGEAFVADHNGVDSVFVGLPYTMVQTLVMAIERAGSTDPAAVRDQVINGKFEGTLMGDVQYDSQGVGDIPPLGLEWINGKRVVAYPAELATGELQWFVPWDQR